MKKLLLALILSIAILLIGCNSKTISTYKVCFFDGNDLVKEFEVEEGKYILELDELEKDGYSFVGWYYNDSEFDFATAVTKDMNIYAKWE